MDHGKATGGARFDLCLLPQVDPEILKINDDYNTLAKELRKKLGLPALAVAAVAAKEDEKK